MSNPTSVLPDNSFLLWLQDEANNEHLTSQSLTQMYTHLAPQADDPLNTFKEDDCTHSFSLNTSIPTKPCPSTSHVYVGPQSILGTHSNKWGFWHSEEIITFWLKFGCCNLPTHLLKALAICWSLQWKDFKTRFRCCPNYLWVKIEQIVQHKVIFHTYWSITCEEDDWFNLQFRRHAHLVWRE